MAKTAAIKQPENHLHDSEHRWFAVHTRSKSEKFVQRFLTKKGIHAYVPLQRLLRRYTRSTRMLEKPLISSYVFVKIVKKEYIHVLETENVAGFVKFNKNMIAIPEEEMAILRRITLEDDIDVEVIPGTVHQGDLVEISAGHLMGLRGRVIEHQGRTRFQVELEHMGFSLLMSVEAGFLHKLG